MGNINNYGESSAHPGTYISATNINSFPDSDDAVNDTSLVAKKSVYICKDVSSQPDMKGLANCEDSILKEALARATAEQKAAVETIAAAADKWAEATYWKLLLSAESLRRRYKPYKADKPNVWVDMSDYNKDEYIEECIENSLYRMMVHVRQWSEHETRVSWHVHIIYPHGNYEDIAGQSMEKFTSMDAAMKYAEGRKKAYAHLFMEEMPPVPQKYLQHFKVFGVLLPGYRAEESAADMKGGE